MTLCRPHRALALLTGPLLVAIGMDAAPAHADPEPPLPYISWAAGVPAGGPASAPTSGAVDLHLTASTTLRIDETTLDPGVPPVAGDAFGASVLQARFTRYPSADWLIGAPGRGGTGAVYVQVASGGGAPTSTVGILRGRQVGDRFGAALASHSLDMYIGAPGRTVDGQAGAGAVDHYLMDDAGIPHYVESITQDTPGVAGTPEAGDGFGSVLATNMYGVAIGVPGEDVGSRKDAGMLTFLPNLDHLPAVSWTQDSPGVAGTAEAGDRFGASVASDPSGARMIVGVPGEDVGALKDAGMVELFNRPGQTPAPWEGLTQDSSGIPGVAEAGDRFGSSVAIGEAMTCYGYVDAAIGSPGEDVGRVVDAGAVTTFPLYAILDDDMSPPAAPKPCAARELTQGSGGLGGIVETGDQVGAVLQTHWYESFREALLIGDPGENVGSVVDAGAVIESLQASYDGGPGFVQTLTDSGGAKTGVHYGVVISSPTG